MTVEKVSDEVGVVEDAAGAGEAPARRHDA